MSRRTSKSITHNWPRTDETGEVRSSLPTDSYREGHERAYGGDPKHINAACCECSKCRGRRVADKVINGT